VYVLACPLFILTDPPPARCTRFPCTTLFRSCVVITGGDSGIGKAIAIAFAREGADVVISYLSDVEDDDAKDTAKWVKDAGREVRSEEHTSELQSRENLVCRLLLEKKKRACCR